MKKEPLCGVCGLRPRASARVLPAAHVAGMCQPCFVELRLENEHHVNGHPFPVYGCAGCGLKGQERPKVTPGGRAAPVASRQGTKVCVVCNEDKPVQQFPTWLRRQRLDECRRCRDERIDRERAAKGKPPVHRCYANAVKSPDTGDWVCAICGRVLVA